MISARRASEGDGTVTLFGRWAPATLLATGVALIAAIRYIATRSHEFQYGSPMLERPIGVFVATACACGAVYLFAVYVVVRRRIAGGWLVWILLAGCAMRAVLFGSNPILEDDYYRYLWDGGVTAAGHNPYAYVPQDVHDQVDAIPSDVIALSQEAGIVSERVNHPGLGTVYPPMAQVFFAIAHTIEPWSLASWRGVLFAVDLAVCGLLLWSLHLASRPLTTVLIYWWNPVLLIEVFNSAHMDLLILPFVLLAYLAAIHRRPVLTFVAGALAVCTKVWPVLLAPPMARYLRKRWDQIAISAVIGAGVLLVVASPMHAALDKGDTSGFVAYSEQWEMNDALFMVILDATAAVDRMFGGLGAGDAIERRARIVVAGLLLALCFGLTWSEPKSPSDLANRLAILAGALFMFSPTQFPWYFVWVLPLLTIAPRPSLLLLSATLPIYYLKFYYVAKGEAAFFHERIVWIEFAPVILLAIWEMTPLGRIAIDSDA